MITVIADTHASSTPSLSGSVADAIDRAELLVHAGDFTGAQSYDEFEKRASALSAVHGNSDMAKLRDRLPSVEIVEWRGWRIVLTHGHEHDRTSLSLLAREREADLVIVGHTHRAGVDRLGALPVLNPGSHAQPRGGPGTYATLSADERGVNAEIRTIDGAVTDRQRILDGQ